MRTTPDSNSTPILDRFASLLDLQDYAINTGNERMEHLTGIVDLKERSISVPFTQLVPLSDLATHKSTGSCVMHSPPLFKPAADGRIDYSLDTSCNDNGTGAGNHSTTVQIESPAFAHYFNYGRGNFEFYFHWQIESVSIVLRPEGGIFGYPWHGSARGQVVGFVRVLRYINNQVSLISSKEQRWYVKDFSFRRVEEPGGTLYQTNKSHIIGTSLSVPDDHIYFIRGGIHFIHSLDLDGAQAMSRINLKGKLVMLEICPILG